MHLQSTKSKSRSLASRYQSHWNKSANKCYIETLSIRSLPSLSSTCQWWEGSKNNVAINAWSGEFDWYSNSKKTLIDIYVVLGTVRNLNSSTIFKPKINWHEWQALYSQISFSAVKIPHASVILTKAIDMTDYNLFPTNPSHNEIPPCKCHFENGW